MNERFTIAYYIFNKEPFIGRIVDCIRQFEGLPVLVFFDGCTDNSVGEFMKLRYGIRNLRTFVNGPHDLFETRCNNFILRTFQTECCILLQDDLLPRNTDFLDLAAKIIDSDPDTGLIGFKDGYEMTDMVNTYTDFVCSPWSFSKSRDRLLELGESMRRTYVNRGPLCVRRAVIDRIGILDEQFAPLFWDDNDYCLRAAKAGMHNYVAYSDVACSPEWGATRSGSKIPCKQIYIANQVRFARKWKMRSPSLGMYRLLWAFYASWRMRIRHIGTCLYVGQPLEITTYE